MIDIIIPAYNAHDTIERTLYSIAYQEIVDKINVFIINDCSNKDYANIVKFFSKFMNIKELKLNKNSGPGVARGYGVSNSNSEYIIFIDSDDVFFDPFSVNRLYDAICQKKCDVVISNFVEEINNSYVEHNKDTIWLHGKIYKRKFLEQNNINFNDSRANEDNGFNQLIMLCDADVKYIDFTTYIWCDNKKSITRNNNYSYFYDLILGYIYNISWALDEAIKRNGNKEKIGVLSFSSLVAIYCNYLVFISDKNVHKILEKSKKIKEISSEYSISHNKKIKILENQFTSFYNTGTKEVLLDPHITFKEFLRMIDEASL